MKLMPLQWRAPMQMSAPQPCAKKPKFGGNEWRKVGPYDDHWNGRRVMSRGDWDAFLATAEVLVAALKEAKDPKAVVINGNTYTLTRAQTYGGTSSSSNVKDFVYTLTRSDGKVVVTSDFANDTPQNYDRTPYVHYRNEEQKIDYMVMGHLTPAVKTLRDALHSVFKVDPLPL